MIPITFLILKNERLNFKFSNIIVEQFLSDRLFFFFKSNPEFVDTLSTAEDKINELIKVGFSGFVVVVDSLQPITDAKLVNAMCKRLSELKTYCCVCEGAISGTAPLAVLNLKNYKKTSKDFSFLCLKTATILRWKTQIRHNNQFNLSKYKRLKQFVSLVSLDSEIYKLTVDEFIDFLKNEKVFKLISSFSENVKTVYYNVCPHCSGSLTSLETSMSQPMFGFIPNTQPLYHECNKCGLVILSPAIHSEDVYKIYDIWDNQDFASSINNPFVSDIFLFYASDARWNVWKRRSYVIWKK